MKNIYLIAEAHLDPMWLWRWEEGYAEALSTFRTAVELIDEFPEFVFCHNESVLYEWVMEADPVLFDKIREKVKEGRWHIPSGWFLQPDCNMPSGESIVRNILHGRQFFQKYFPEAMPTTTAINFDPLDTPRDWFRFLRRQATMRIWFVVPAKMNSHLKTRILYGRDFTIPGFVCTAPTRIITLSGVMLPMNCAFS